MILFVAMDCIDMPFQPLFTAKQSAIEIVAYRTLT